MEKLIWNTKLLVHFYASGRTEFQMPFDTYPCWTCFIVEEGHFYYQMNEIQEKAVKHDIVLCPPNTTLHRQTNNLSFHLFKFNWVSEGPSNLQEFTNNGIIRIINKKRLHSTLSLLKNTKFSDHSLELEYKNHLFQDLWKLFVIESTTLQPNTLTSDDLFAQKAILLLHEHLNDGPVLGLIAENLGISQTQLTRLFTKEFHTTPKAYLQKIRLNRVQYLLVNTSSPLSEIAEQCGFTDEHHLSKSFKKQIGMNPSVFRKNHLV